MLPVACSPVTASNEKLGYTYTCTLVSRLHTHAYKEKESGNTSQSPGDYGTLELLKFVSTNCLQWWIEVLTHTSILNVALILKDVGLCHQTLFLMREWELETLLWSATTVIYYFNVVSDGKTMK